MRKNNLPFFTAARAFIALLPILFSGAVPAWAGDGTTTTVIEVGSGAVAAGSFYGLARKETAGDRFDAQRMRLGHEIREATRKGQSKELIERLQKQYEHADLRRARAGGRQGWLVIPALLSSGVFAVVTIDDKRFVSDTNLKERVRAPVRASSSQSMSSQAMKFE